MKLINDFFIGNIENLDINWEFVNSIPEFNICFMVIIQLN